MSFVAIEKLVLWVKGGYNFIAMDTFNMCKPCYESVSHADMEAERDNPEMYRYHAAEALLLQAQIDNHTQIIEKYTAPPPGPKWIKADTPHKENYYSTNQLTYPIR